MSRPGRPRNPRGEGGRLREEVLAAAVALIDETGEPTSLTLRGIARQAGVSAPSLYAHFDDLPSLIDAVLAVSFDQLRSGVDNVIRAHPADDPAGALIAAGLAYVQFGWDHPARYRLMFNADGYAANAMDTFTAIQTLVSACVEAGVGHSTNPRKDTWMLWAGLHGVATLQKPARAQYRRLGVIDRPAMLTTMIRRLTCLDESVS